MIPAKVRTLANRVRIMLLVEAKMLLQRFGIPGRADVFLPNVWDWRYPPYLLLSLHEDQVVECPVADLPFVLAYSTLPRFFLRARGVRPGRRPTAHTVIGAREDDLAPWFRRRVRISYDYFGDDGMENTLTMPYFCHPDFYRLGLHVEAERRRDERRNIRVLFAGTADDAKYERQFAFPLITRTEILQTVATAFTGDLTVAGTRQELSALNGTAQRLLFVLSSKTDDTTERHLITPHEYLGLLARSDFFLAPPGWVMPHCHNIIEAMSVGTIPVTNYGRYLCPPLEPGVNCIGFDTRAGLIEQIQRVLEMPESQVAELRANVIGYHDRHLSVSAFRRQLDAHAGPQLTLRVNVEPGR